MTAKLILVTGATGYIASRLIPQLVERGYRVRASARHPDQLQGRPWFPAVEVAAGDVMSPQSLPGVLEGVDSAYYLIHNMSSGKGYTARELQGARNFASAAARAGLQHIIYLGGLADPHQPIAPHMRSRIETGEVLREGTVPVTEFRAGVIVGPGSISFEMIRFLTEHFPVLPGPNWLRNRSQPIAAQNVLDYLVAGLENPDGRGRIFEIGGPEQRLYSDLMLSYARLRGLHRRLLTVPGIPVPFMAWWVDKLTPVHYPIALALVDGLRSDSIVREDSARQVFSSVQLIDYETAVRGALEKLRPEMLEPVWADKLCEVKVLKHEGFFVDYRRREVKAAHESVYRVFASMGGRNGWPYANWLWHLRGRLDSLFGSRALPRRGGGPDPDEMMDYYRIEVREPEQRLRLHSELHAPGQGWIEWRVQPVSGHTSVLTQTTFYAPRGLAGCLYWYVLLPWHRLVLRGLIRAIASRSESL